MISDFKNKKILLISPHPDDIEIGMGGTAVLLSKKNKLSHITCIQYKLIIAQCPSTAILPIDLD